MAIRHRASPSLARTLLFCAFFLAAPSLSFASGSNTVPTSRPLQDLIPKLENWLDENTSLPRPTSRPVIRWVDFGPVAPPSDSRLAVHDENSRGFYDPDSRTIWLVRPWSASDPHDVSVLLHELVHHRQAEKGHWYCPGAQELPAYKLQQAWLDGFGLKTNVNWIAVVLESGCTPRDIHPD